MGDINQDDIDKLLAGAMGDDAGGDAPAAPAPDPALEGVASQDDIDALFAAVGGDDPPETPAPAAPEPAPAAPPGEEEGGVASQDDIDALFAAVGGDEPAEPAAEPEPAPATPAKEEESGAASQSDIDALFSAGGDSAPDVPPAADDHAMVGQDDIDSLLASVTADAPPPPPAAEDETPTSDESNDINELLSNFGPAGAAESAAKEDDTVRVDTVDMDELLNQINSSAPPPPPARPEAPAQAPQANDQASTVVLPPDFMSSLEEMASALPPGPALQPSPAPAAAAPPAAPQFQMPQTPPPPLNLPPPSASAPLRDNRSVLSSAGEVESMASQITGMLGQLSEKAHRYMQAWLTADSEAKELRGRLLNEEHLRSVAIGEKDAMIKEVEFLRSKLGSLEGEKLGSDEARRTSEAALQSQIRELESRIKILNSEVESLKDELTRSRTEATGVDIESRRARFEADRLKSEIESERMERLRIQRALENREKELQAMQAQSAGQASSLFIDELHRLVRRLESELDARSSGAHEALRQLDRLDVPEDMVPVVSNLRASLMQAIGADADSDDALRALGREADRVRGPKGVEAVKTEMVSFESSLATYNLGSALEIAGALLREVKATPASLMRRIYQSPALRRPEVVEHLSDLSRLLEGLRTVQESADRARGGESGESEVFYVQMFDFLHNLVRLKLVTRLTGEMWRIFLDLRGRFSFVTSDKQWADYRDGVLGEKLPK